ncbi:MAG TPA: radical SAM family heme chaperone HemW [Clostridia bacterium]
MKKVGIYIHIPFCRSKCNYCAFNSFFADIDAQKRYVEYLVKEILSFDYKGEITVDTVYFGGGTPSFLYEGGIIDIVNALKNRFKYLPREVSIECNPESLTQKKLEEYRSAGINRISVGLQSASDRLLKKAGRIHTLDDFLRSIRYCSEAGFDNVNCDIMLGLPRQSVDDVLDTLNILFGLPIIKHISMYGLKVEKNTPWQDIKVDEDLSADMYDAAFDALLKNGFYRYEISNFSKPGFECAHNIKYWTRQDYIGFGLSAHSLLDNVRFANPDSLKDYYEGKKERLELTPAQAEEEFIMLGLRMEKGIDINEYNKQFNVNFTQKYAKPIEKLNRLGVIDLADNILKIKPKYMGVMNSIIVEFFS